MRTEPFVGRRNPRIRANSVLLRGCRSASRPDQLDHAPLYAPHGSRARPFSPFPCPARQSSFAHDHEDERPDAEAHRACAGRLCWASCSSLAVPDGRRHRDPGPQRDRENRRDRDGRRDDGRPLRDNEFSQDRVGRCKATRSVYKTPGASALFDIPSASGYMTKSWVPSLAAVTSNESERTISPYQRRASKCRPFRRSAFGPARSIVGATSRSPFESTVAAACGSIHHGGFPAGSSFSRIGCRATAQTGCAVVYDLPTKSQSLASDGRCRRSRQSCGRGKNGRCGPVRQLLRGRVRRELANSRFRCCWTAPPYGWSQWPGSW